MSVLLRVNNFLTSVCKLAICILLPTMGLAVFLQVGMRYVFASPFSWTEEFVKFLLVLLTCYGAAYVLRIKQHIAFHLVTQHLPQKFQSSLILVIHFALLALFTTVLIQSFALALFEWNQISPVMRIRIGWIYLGMSVSFAIMFMFEAEALLEDLKRLVRKSGSR